MKIMGIKLVASDLDGTLFTDEKTISDEARRTLEEIAEKRILFIPCTGRAFASIPELVRTLPGVQYMIVSNGSAVYRAEDGVRVYGSTLSTDTIDRILSLPFHEEMTFEVQIQGESYTEQRYIDDPARFGATGFGVSYIRKTRHGVADLRVFAEEHKTEIDEMIFVSARKEQRVSFHEALLNFVPDIRITSSVPNLIEVGHVDADKGKTLGRFMQMNGIAMDEAMAFGDAGNDISMLTAVRYGFAMANATDECKAAAYAVAEENNADGVAKMIRKYCL